MIRETYVYLFDGTAQTNMFLIEMVFGVIVPWVLLLLKTSEKNRSALFFACTLIVGGVLLNRINVFVVGFTPPVSKTTYFPAVGELLITVGLIATLMLIYRLIVTFLPVLSARSKELSI